MKRPPRRLTPAEQALVEIRTLLAKSVLDDHPFTDSDLVLVGHYVSNGLELWTTRGKNRARQAINAACDREELRGCRL